MRLRTSFNPFIDITDSKEQPYSRLLRSSIWTKFQDTYRVIMGNIGIVDANNGGRFISVANEHARPKMGIVDLLLFGFLLKGMFVVATLLVEHGVHLSYRGWYSHSKGFVSFLSGLAMAIIVAPIMLALIIPTIAIGLALLTASFLSVPVVHAISAIAANKHAKLIIEMFQKGLLKKDNGVHQGDQIVGKKTAQLFYREFCSIVDRRKIDVNATGPNKATYTNGKSYTLSESVIAPGSLSMFADRMTPAQRANLKYTQALKALNMFNHSINVSLGP